MNHRSNGDDLWRQLSEARHVEEPDPEVFRKAYEGFLEDTADAGETTPAPARANRRRPMLIAAAVVVAAGISLPALVGGDVTVSEGATPGAESTGAPDPIPSPHSSTTNDPSPTAPTTTLNAGSAGGSLVAFFGEPTFEAFTRTPYVAEVVEGTVVGTTSRYVPSGDDGSIITELEVQVTRAREGEAGRTITVFESGGIVAKRDMLVVLEQKFGTLSEDELTGFVEERHNGQPPALVGDRVLLAIGSEVDQLGPMVVARLVASAGLYAWGFEPPNPRWLATLDDAQVDQLFS